MNKLLIICGSTATGKTALGIKLAKKFNGEIVSADSRQVYKGMDIGTGKDLPVNSKLKVQNSRRRHRASPKRGYAAARSLWRRTAKLQFKTKNLTVGYYMFGKTPVWLLDIVNPDFQFSVADYVRCADLVIEDIWRRGKLPILVGGTGFYIKAVVDGIETIGVEPDWKLREKLSNLEIEKLREKLKRLDPKKWKRMNESDRSNPRRLIRAIEIAKQNQILNIKKQKYKLNIKNILFIGLKTSYQKLYERIDRRVEERVKQGAVEEIERLLKLGYSWENSVLGQTIGYKEWKRYFRTMDYGLQTKKLMEDTIQRWKYNEHALARRQMTWFKKDKRIFWFDISQKGWENKTSLFSCENKTSLFSCENKTSLFSGEKKVEEAVRTWLQKNEKGKELEDA